jgi:hypothetical protein
MNVAKARQFFDRPWAIAVVVTAGLFLLSVGISTVAPQPDTATSKPKKESRTAQPSVEQPEQPLMTSNYTFPGGGRELLPEHRIVALYGSPASKRLGALGEQPLQEAVARAKKVAAQYQPHTSKRVLPAFEIIATVASATPTKDGDYSSEVAMATLRPWIAAAKKKGMYVVLDLQPGRKHFLTQAKMYEPLLREPHVGLALDPEWRLAPHQIHLEQIGSVTAEEVNQVADWLADLTKKYHLPQKMFLLHQFRLSMIKNRAQLDTSHKELAYVIQMDGNGAQSTKLDTWRVIRAGAPQNIYFGWKNFYDEDHPALSPQQTMKLAPVPWYVSYQ